MWTMAMKNQSRWQLVREIPHGIRPFEEKQEIPWIKFF